MTSEERLQKDMREAALHIINLEEHTHMGRHYMPPRFEHVAHGLLSSNDYIVCVSEPEHLFSRGPEWSKMVLRVRGEKSL